MTVQAETHIPQAEVPPCPPWCAFGDCAGNEHRVDRVHFGEALRGSLTLHKREAMVTAEPGGSRLGYVTFEVQLRQHAEAVAPSVELGILEEAPALSLTIDEARELAAALLEVCDQSVA